MQDDVYHHCLYMVLIGVRIGMQHFVCHHCVVTWLGSLCKHGYNMIFAIIILHGLDRDEYMYIADIKGIYVYIYIYICVCVQDGICHHCFTRRSALVEEGYIRKSAIIVLHGFNRFVNGNTTCYLTSLLLYSLYRFVVRECG